MTESLRSLERVNSEAYWNDRFSANWEALGGHEQSRQFMEVLIKFLPAAIYEEIASKRLSLLDCGCAEGDGTAVLSRTFPRSAVAGFDFSSTAIEGARNRFSTLDFFVATFLELNRTADVLISSNCFEHLENAVSALAHLASCARRYLMLLVPFLERFPPDHEHVRIVHPASFPESVGGWRLTHRIVIPPLPVWPQNQLLMIYQPRGAADEMAETAPAPESLFLESLVAGKLESLVAGKLEGLVAGKLEGLVVGKLEGLVAAQARLESSQRKLERWQAEFGAFCRSQWQQEQEILAGFGRRLEALQSQIETRLSALESVDLEVKRQRGWMEALRHDLAGARLLAERRELARQQIEAERDALAVRYQEKARQLATLEGSLAVRILFRFWRLLARLLPEGTRRRKLYRAVRGLPGRRSAPTLPPGEALKRVETPSARLQDPWAELHQFEERVRKAGAERVVAIFASTQLRDDEGQRPTQLALGLSQRGIPVVFVYWRWHTSEWCTQHRLEDGILQIPIDVVTGQPDRLASAFAGMSRIALFEFPHPSFFGTLAAANAEGWITVYDVIDDWEEFQRVGQAIWYEESFERHMITAADAVFAINEVLAGRVRDLGGGTVEIVPNGVRPGIEVVGAPCPLERGEVTVGYFGYLAGAWFDWRLLAAAAILEPSWRFYLIGYGGSPEGIHLPDNIVLLGKHPQSELAAQAANWDVAIIPFKPDRLAAGADPIKTYEYLAMGLPVVVTGVFPPLGGEPFVTRAEGVEEFLREIARAAAHAREDVEARRAFVGACTWSCRLDAMLTAIAEGRQRVAEKQALFGSRR